MVDGLTGARSDPFNRYHMGVTAENVAERCAIDRATQDDAAFESHRRASQACREGRFTSQILPIEVRAKGKTVTFDRDEHVRHGAARGDFESLRPKCSRRTGRSRRATPRASTAAALRWCWPPRQLP